jgi:hypothetical protein
MVADVDNTSARVVVGQHDGEVTVLPQPPLSENCHVDECLDLYLVAMELDGSGGR